MRQNIYQRTIKMKLVNVKPSIYINFDVKNNEKDPKLKMIISEY